MELPEGCYSQLCFVVNDLDATARRWSSAVGAGPWYVMRPTAEDKIYRGQQGEDTFLLALAFLDATCLELYQPLDDKPSILREILDSRGEGLHHVWPGISGLRGQSFDAKCKEYEDRGFEVAMRCRFPEVGRAVFFDALDSIGAFIEVLELGDRYPMYPALRRAHLDWDGHDPVRPFETLFGD